MRANIISILSGKGGSGKSIISASLSNFLAHCNKKTLLIDLDIFTRGVSFYLLAHKPYEAKNGIADFFRNNEKNENYKFANGRRLIQGMTPLLINEKYTKGNLSFIPASSNLDAFYLEDNLLYSERDLILSKLNELFYQLRQSDEFDYIIVDTPGGNNFISNIVANLSHGYILTTEADKTSWETIELLLSGIEKIGSQLNESNRYESGQNLGFILNKNTLPPKDIVAFLKRRFRTRELVTIPLDIEAVRCYQNDEIPIISSLDFDFSKKIVELTENLFSPVNYWDKESIRIIDGVKKKISEESERKKIFEKKVRMTLQLNNLFPLISSLLGLTLGAIVLTEKIKFSNVSLAMFFIAIGYLAIIPSVIARFYKRNNNTQQ